MNLLDELDHLLDGEVMADADTRNAYSRDASLFRVEPRVVAFPKSEADVERLVEWVSARKAEDPSLSLTARSAGTDMSGGPLSESIVVDLARHFTRIASVSPETQTAVVQPGVFYRDFEKATLAHGLLLPCYPASRELCTVGGMAANNSGGEKTLAYGKTARYVKHLRVVLADGKAYDVGPLTAAQLEEKIGQETFEGHVYRNMRKLLTENAAVIDRARPNVSKNSAGYALWDVMDPETGTFDLTKLFVGSQGTLGLLTEIEYALIRPKPHARLLVILLPDMKPLAEIAKRVSAHAPESFESYDDHTMRVALKVLPSLLRRMKGNFLRLAWQFLPEARMALTGGLPKLVLIAEFTADTEAEAEAKATRAQDDLASFGVSTRVTRSEAEGEKYWVVRRESFNLLRQHVKNLRTAPFIDDFIVRPERLSEFLPELYAVLERYDLLFTVAGHVGDGNFHIIPLMDFTKPGVADVIRGLSKEVYALVLRYGGSITGEHNDGLIRSPFLADMFGPELMSLFAETKRIFDPQAIFNPGKKIGSDLERSLRHLDA